MTLPVTILTRNDRDRILNKLERFGIHNLSGIHLVKIGKDKIRAFSSDLSREEIQKLVREINVELIGLYIAKEENENEIRLTIDGCHLFSSQISENVIELTDEQTLDWFRGRDIELKEAIAKGKELYGFYVLKNKDNLLGTGKVKEGRILNFIPKDRRIKN